MCNSNKFKIRFPNKVAHECADAMGLGVQGLEKLLTTSFCLGTALADQLQQKPALVRIRNGWTGRTFLAYWAVRRTLLVSLKILREVQ